VFEEANNPFGTKVTAHLGNAAQAYNKQFNKQITILTKHTIHTFQI